MKERKFDSERIQNAVRELLLALGDNPDREGLKGTPDRVARMYEEVFEGMAYTNEQIAEMFNTSFEEEAISGDLVLIKDIPIFSYCEHHLALMYNMKVHVAYLPKGKVLGLSKVARIADMVGKRLQLQERIGTNIADIMEMATGSPDVIVVIEGQHSCMTARGIKSGGSVTRTSTLRGLFNSDKDLRAEVYSLLK